MKFLPIENITYKTKLKTNEVVERLSDVIEPGKTFRLGIFGNNSTKLYQGDISDLTFDIRRIISYRNSFLPRISGVIQNDFNGTTITVKMRMHIFVIIFICF